MVLFLFFFLIEKVAFVPSFAQVLLIQQSIPDSLGRLLKIPFSERAVHANIGKWRSTGEDGYCQTDFEGKQGIIY